MLQRMINISKIFLALLWRQKQPPEVFCKKGFLRGFLKFAGKHLYQGLFFNKVVGNTGKHLCQSFFFNKVAGKAYTFIEKETLAQVFSCEFCEISKNTFFTGHLRTTAFEHFQNVFSSIVKTGDNNPSLASFGKLLCIHAILIRHK